MENFGVCEDCGVETELFAMTYEQRYLGEPHSHCQDCADEISQKTQERMFHNYHSA